MAEESEKRFHAAMDKLFLPSSPSPNSKSTITPPPSISVTAGGSSRGRKHPYSMTTTLALVEPKSRGNTIQELRNASNGTVKSPMCRPWEREDLLKRLATFKSMTWFAKPEVISAINCATRGWVNVDIDTIACESCGSRLFFSTPTSWAQQQVENTASVFSLKLNNGHKLLCPWVDNACDEKLAQFPPTSPVDLVDNYKNRCALLLQLLELPVISSTAIDYMSSPLLEHFLKCPPTLDECEEVLPVLYYLAQKLISLCGWEPQLLPYVVDCKDVQQNASITVYSSQTSENVVANEGFSTENEQYDHTSVVLDCRLCGARVGLWAFSTTPRPSEFVRFIGHAEPSVETSLAQNGEQTESITNSGTTSSNRNLLNLTIAGGPPPAEQNFRPKISLPVVGQNLRTRFSSAFESVDDDDLFTSNESLGGDSVMRTPVSGTTKTHTTTENQLEKVDEFFSNSSGNAPEDLVNVETVNLVARDLATSLNNVSDTSISVDDYLQTPGNTLNSSSSYLGKDSKQPSSAKAMEFDPIKQHRYFCPWIASSGKSAPGWKQTLSALERQKEFIYPSEATHPSSSIIEVKDPVGSVRKLLTPPSAKRKKFTHGSS